MIEELKGMAKVSDLDLADLMALNVRTEIMFGFSQSVSAECSAYAHDKGSILNLETGPGGKENVYYLGA